jgi:hypothetical protein
MWHSLSALHQVKDAHGEGSRAVSVGCHSPLSTAFLQQTGHAQYEGQNSINPKTLSLRGK